MLKKCSVLLVCVLLLCCGARSSYAVDLCAQASAFAFRLSQVTKLPRAVKRGVTILDETHIAIHPETENLVPHQWETLEACGYSIEGDNEHHIVLHCPEGDFCHLASVNIPAEE